MPKFTIDLTDKALTGLQAQTDRYNGNTGGTLTVQQWILLHLNEMAIADDLAAAADQLRRDAERDGQAALDGAVRAARDQLLTALEP